MSEPFPPPFPRQPPRLNPASPWPGPAAYAEADTGFFHGRAAETAELHRLVRAESASVLFALSGLGKTSLLQAGLFPRLRAEGWLPVRLRLDHSEGAAPLTTQVLDAVTRAARDQFVSAPSWDSAHDTLVQAFQERGEGFWGESEEEPVTPVLVFDQFEEAWTQTRERPEARANAEALLAQVAAMLDWSGSRETVAAPVRVIFSLREDQIAPLDALRHLFPGLRRARLRLLPFTTAQAREVVEKPASELLGPGAAEAIVETFSGPDATRPVADPALLAIFCWRLNEDRRSRQVETITTARVQALRGEFVQQFYDQAFAQLDPAQAESARRFIEADLIDAAGFRTSAGFQHAERKFGVTAATLELLADQRLLHPVDRSGGQRHVELVHDRLAEEAARRRSIREEAEATARSEKERAHLALRLARSRRRNFLFAGLSATALAAAAFAVVQWREAVASSERARVAQAQALESKNSADLAKDKALAAKIAAEGLISFMQYDLRDGLGQLGRLDLMKDINDRISLYYEQHPPTADDTAALREMAIMLGERAELLQSKGKLREGIEKLRESGAIITRLLAQQPDNWQWRRDLAVNRSSFGSALATAGETREALALFRQAFPELEKLSAEKPEITQILRDFATCHTVYADALATTGDAQGAMDLYLKCMGIRERLYLDNPNSARTGHDVSLIYGRIGDALEKSGDITGALGYHDKAHKILTKLTESDPANTTWQNDISLSYLKIGDCMKSAGDISQAMSYYREAVRLRQKLSEHDPANRQWHRDYWVSYMVLGEAAREDKDESAGISIFEKALPVIESLAEADPGNASLRRDVSTNCFQIGLSLESLSNNEGALEWYRKSLSLRSELAKLDPGNLSWGRDEYVTLIRASRMCQALQRIPEALEITEAALASSLRLGALEPQVEGWKERQDSLRELIAELKTALKKAP